MDEERKWGFEEAGEEFGSDSEGEEEALEERNADPLQMIRLMVRVEDEEFVMACGNGSQDVRWLAMAAAERYKSMHRAGGRVRHRESHLGAMGAYLPRSVRRKPVAKGPNVLRLEIVGPTLTVRELCDRLRSQASDEASMRSRAREELADENRRRLRVKQAPLSEEEWFSRAGIDLVTASDDRGKRWLLDEKEVERLGLSAALSIRVDLALEAVREENGALSQSMWSALAFNFSEEGVARGERLLVEHEEELRQIAMAEAAEREEIRRKEVEAMDKLLDIDPADEKAVLKSMEGEWRHVRVQRVAKDEEDALDCKRVMLRFFGALSDLYKHYSGTSVRGSSSSMEYQEFEHFCLLTGAADPVRERRLLARVFKEANAQRIGSSEALAEDQLSRFEFFEAVLHLAVEKNGERPDGNHRPASEALDILCTEKLAPQAEKLSAGPVRTALRDPRMQRLLARVHDRIRRVFDFYCALEPPSSSLLVPSGGAAAQEELEKQHKVVMDEREFCLCLEAAGIMLPTGSGGGAFGISSASSARGTVTRAVAREAFAGVQRDDDGSAAPGGLSKADAAETMVFNEFIEAIARIGVHRWADESVSVARKIRWIFHVIADLDDHLGTPRDELVEPPQSLEEEKALDNVGTSNSLTLPQHPTEHSQTHVEPHSQISGLVSVAAVRKLE